MNILVLGASGMLGNAVFRFFLDSSGYNVTGTLRSDQTKCYFNKSAQPFLVTGVDVENIDSLIGLFGEVKPDIVVNCIGLVKQLSEADDPLFAIPINSLLPHRLAKLCSVVGARLVHLSTDCVYSGRKGMYLETDQSDANDLYGRSKYLGEVDYPNAITLRTSIIGHELNGARSLVDWFLAQTGTVSGYKKAIFSGLPTVEIARVIRDFILPNPSLYGVYHVSADPINKYELLRLVSKTYNKQIEILPDENLVIDRSLDSSKFRAETGFTPQQWPQLVELMNAFG